MSLKIKKLKVTFLWVPGHVGLLGNERADAEAKNPESSLLTPLTFSDAKKLIKREVWDKYQDEWYKTENNKLRKVKDTVKPWQNIYQLNRKDSTIITRLRLGHTNLTHIYLITKEPPPICECGSGLNVEHIFTCTLPNRILARRQYQIKDLSDLSTDNLEKYNDIISYLKKINYHHLI